MPIYEYECQKCGHRLELIQGYDGKAPEGCPECSGQMVKVMHPAAPIFKGAGFYHTDSRSQSAKPDKKPAESPCQSCPKDCPSAGGE